MFQRVLKFLQLLNDTNIIVEGTFYSHSSDKSQEKAYMSI